MRGKRPLAAGTLHPLIVHLETGSLGSLAWQKFYRLAPKKATTGSRGTLGGGAQRRKSLEQADFERFGERECYRSLFMFSRNATIRP